MSKNRNEYDKKYEDKRAGQRTRNWAVIFYPEDLPENWTSMVDDLLVKWIEGPIHDKDFNADGQPKKLHCHTLFMFSSVKTFEQIKSMFIEIFGQSENGSIIGIASPQIANDRSAVVRYMAHMDNPDKFQYDVSGIIGHNGADVSDVLRFSSTETRQMIVEMEEYIEQNGITELSDFSRAIRYEKPEWHNLLSTKMTFYFSSFIRSCRHKKEMGMENVKIVKVDDNGEIIE